MRSLPAPVVVSVTVLVACEERVLGFAAETKDRTRLVLNMDKLVPYDTRVDGNNIIVLLGGGRQFFMPFKDGGKRSDGRDLIAELAIPNLKLQFDIYHCQIIHGDVTMRLREMMPIMSPLCRSFSIEATWLFGI